MSVSRTAKIISGKIIADQIRSELIVEIEALRRKNVTPGLAVVLVGENPASQVYVRNKRKTCAELGLHSFDVDLPADVTERRLLASIDKLNRDPKVHGILVQMPLPKHLHEQKVLNAILPEKDVDGFHPVNAGKLLIGEPGFAPCTAAGCQELLLRSGYDPAGKHVVIVGRSNIVGKPLAALLMQKAAGANATVTVCHSRTRHLAALTRQADILVAAIGIPEFITRRMIKDKAVVIDVGINRIDDPTRASGTRLVGDVHFAQALKKARAITPVPGGVGLMTVIMLMRNTVSAAKQQTSR